MGHGTVRMDCAARGSPASSIARLSRCDNVCRVRMIGRRNNNSDDVTANGPLGVVHHAPVEM